MWEDDHHYHHAAPIIITALLGSGVCIWNFTLRIGFLCQWNKRRAGRSSAGHDRSEAAPQPGMQHRSVLSSLFLLVRSSIILCAAPQLDAVCSSYLSADLKFWVSALWCWKQLTCIAWLELFTALWSFFPGFWCLRWTLCVDAGSEVKGTSDLISLFLC